MSTNFSPTPAELTLVSQIFAQADPQKLGVLTGDVAVRVFGGAKLPPTTLGEIWNLSDEDNKGWLPKKGVAIAVRLIGWAQKGEKITQALANKPGPLAVIEGINTITKQTTGMSLPKSPPPPAFPPLTNQDKAKFQNMFAKYGPENGLLSGDKSRDIFVKSKLSNEQLLKIWNLADTQDRGALDAVDFAIGMYFIQGVMTKKITFIPTSLPPGLYQQAGGSTNAGSIRSHMTGGSGSFSPVGSAFPPQHTGQRLQPEYTGSFTAPNLPARPSAPTESNGHVAEWDVTPAEKAASDRHFDTLDTQRKGFIEGEIAVPFMLKSQLPGEILAQVWDLADINNDGCLTRDGFAIAMHLIQKKLAGQEVPSTLPSSLVPPSKRQHTSGASPFPSTTGQHQAPEPPVDLFSFDDTPPSSAGPMQTMHNTGSMQSRVTAPTPNVFPPPPAQRAPETDPFSAASPFQTSSLHQDLLGDDAHTSSTLIHDQSAEIGNMKNQLQSTNRSLASAKEERATLEQTLASQASQLSTLQTQLSSAKAAYETETSLLATLRDRHSTQLSEIQKTREELIRAESDLSAIRVEKSEIEGAFLRDKEEARDLHKRMVETGQQAEGLKADVEKLKKEAKQQKGLLAIARKQLSTKESEKARAEKEHEASLAEVASVTQEKEEVEGEIANLDAVLPAQKAAAFPSPTSSLMFAASQPLPTTPSPDLLSQGGKSNNPFERLAMASDNSAPRSQSPFLGPSNTLISSPPLTHESLVPANQADVTPQEATKSDNSPVPDHDTEISYLTKEPDALETIFSPETASGTDYFVTPPTSARHDSSPPPNPAERFPSLDDLSPPPPALPSTDNATNPVSVTTNLNPVHKTDLNTQLKEIEIDDSDSDEETDENLIAGKTTNGNVSLAPAIPLPHTYATQATAPVDSFDDVFGSDEPHDKPLNGVSTAFESSLPTSDFIGSSPAVEQTPVAGVNEFDEALGKLPGSVAATPALFSFDTAFDDNFDFASASNAVDVSSAPSNEQKGKAPGNAFDSFSGMPTTLSESPLQPPFTHQLSTPVTTNDVPKFESAFEEAFSGSDSVAATKSEDKPVTTAPVPVHPQDDRSMPALLSSPIQTSPKVATTSSRVVEVRPVSPPRAASPSPRVVSPKPRISSSSSKEIHEKPKETNVRHSKLSIRLPFGKKKKHQEPMPAAPSQHLSPPLEQPYRTTTPASEDDVEPVKQLTAMGFSRGQAVDALEKYGYDVQKALNSLLGSQ